MRASSEGHHETVEALLADGADVSVKDKVSRGDGCEGAPMGARKPWTGCLGLFKTCERSNRLNIAMT